MSKKRKIVTIEEDESGEYEQDFRNHSPTPDNINREPEKECEADNIERTSQTAKSKVEDNQSNVSRSTSWV